MTTTRAGRTPGAPPSNTPRPPLWLSRFSAVLVSAGTPTITPDPTPAAAPSTGPAGGSAGRGEMVTNGETRHEPPRAVSSGAVVLGVLNGLLIGLLAVGLVLVYKSNRF